jgi:ABC-type nitrate/sulfonate/bicarbonate transport system substrate-binding protein
MFEAAMWALKNGRVKSDAITVELSVLSIPALIQATPTKRYDVIQSDTISVPRSAERGLALTIMSTAIRYRPDGQGHHIFVPRESTVQSIADLKGGKIGVPSIGSAGFHLLRFALAESSTSMWT